jgi:hypothetical protein
MMLKRVLTSLIIPIGIVAGAGILFSASQANHTMAGSAAGLQLLGKTDAAEGKGEEQGGYYRIAL